MRYPDLSENPLLSKLKKLAPFGELWMPPAVSNGPLAFSYGTAFLNKEILEVLGQLAQSSSVTERAKKLMAGEIVNLSENRPALHHRTRSQDRGFYGEQQQRIAEFSRKVHSQQHYKKIVQIGIGGSELGPCALYYALGNQKRWLQAEIISNFDANLDEFDLETTLFIVVSKSGTTPETLSLWNRLGRGKQAIAVTGKGSPMDAPDQFLDIFYIDDAIGGRFSATSAVGGCLISLAYGPDVFEELLQGAAELDKFATRTDPLQNISLLSALICIWQRNILGLSARAVIPYCSALNRLPGHLQQLECESNGKRVNQYGQPIAYGTAPVIFGEPGTNAQHSFFQMFHQGTDITPIQFIGIKGATDLNANLAAQIVALAAGHPDPDPNKHFPGRRPSTLIMADSISPRSVGALLAFFENQVMFEGFLWNVNSFDQEGVQLGKRLARDVLNKKGNTELQHYWNLAAEV